MTRIQRINRAVAMVANVQSELLVLNDPAYAEAIERIAESVQALIRANDSLARANHNLVAANQLQSPKRICDDPNATIANVADCWDRSPHC